MENKENIEEITSIVKKLHTLHYPPGRLQTKINQIQAQMCMKTDELEVISHLVESHAPCLRMKAVLRYEKKLCFEPESNRSLTLSKNHVASNCKTRNISDNVNQMLERIKEMPSEWTLVQLTPFFKSEENVKVDKNKFYTNHLYVTVFNCGENQPQPFCVSVDAPRDSVNGAPIELMQESYSIREDSCKMLKMKSGGTHFKGVAEQQQYYTGRTAIDDRLTMLVKNLQDLYLREWKCLFIGKYIKSHLEDEIKKRLKEFLKTEAPSLNLDEKSQCILHYLIKGAHYLKILELKRAVQTVIPQDKPLQKQMVHFIRSVSDVLSLGEQKRHPIILILDDSLDCLPWEMMEILLHVQVSRLPSIHIAYALFKEHKETIQNGFKIVQKPEKGRFVVNPNLDLRCMQNRVMSFYDYWLPGWEGISGCQPTEEEFEEMLVSGEVFAYNGHGNGAHFFPSNKIEKIRIKAVVLLFGCSSAKLNVLGPQTEMYGTYQMYLISCSPCIIGNLWEVTDLDTDILSTEILSLWIPNDSGKPHWKHLKKQKWNKGERVTFETNHLSKKQYHSPELLKALSYSRRSDAIRYYATKAAVVARGIPVKIISK